MFWPPLRSLTLVAVASFVLPFLSVLTFFRAVDGAFVAHVATHLCAAAAALAIALAVLAHRSRAVRRKHVTVWPAVLVALGLSAPATVIHLVRSAGREASVTASFGTPLEYGRVLVPVLRGASAMTVEREHVALRTPAGSVGFLEVRPLGITGVTVPPLLLPRSLALTRPEAANMTITWRARIERERGYFGLVDLDGERFVAQITASGLLITAPGPDGRPSGETVNVAVDDGWHEWTVRRRTVATELVMDGKTVWFTPLRARFDPVRIGEARSDAEHGGTLRLSQARVTRSLT
jgi:hypothetical protein